MKKIIMLFTMVTLITIFLCSCADSNDKSNLVSSTDTVSASDISSNVEEFGAYDTKKQISKIASIDELELGKISKITANPNGRHYTTEDEEYITQLCNIIKKAKICDDKLFPLPENEAYPELMRTFTFDNEKEMYTFQVCKYKRFAKLNIDGCGLNFFCDICMEDAQEFFKLNETISKEVPADK